MQPTDYFCSKCNAKCKHRFCPICGKPTITAEAAAAADRDRNEAWARVKAAEAKSKAEAAEAKARIEAAEAKSKAEAAEAKARMEAAEAKARVDAKARMEATEAKTKVEAPTNVATVKKYQVIQEQSVTLSDFSALSRFVKEVNEAISKGWEPIGGLSVTRVPFIGDTGLGVMYTQAMVKRS